MSHPTSSERALEHRTLVKLLISVTVLRDELDRTLQHSDALHDRAEALARALLGGHPAALDPLRGQLLQTAQSMGHSARWLACAEQHLAALLSAPDDADPLDPALPAPARCEPSGSDPAAPDTGGVRLRVAGGGLGSPVVEGLLALIDGLALLTPWGSTSAETHQHLRATRACAEGVLVAALRGRSLASPLAELTEQQSRLLALGPAPQTGALRLGEAIEALLVQRP